MSEYVKVTNKDVNIGVLLFVQEMRAELAHLAHRCSEIDKYRVETCCIIGEFQFRPVYRCLVF